MIDHAASGKVTSAVAFPHLIVEQNMERELAL